jgi:tRNA-dihydrouridine synthase
VWISIWVVLVPNVVQNGKGSGLIGRPEVAADLIQASKAGGLLVSLKTRIGYKM